MMPGFEGDKKSTWLEHAWDAATLEWLKSLTPQQREAAWRASFERANSFLGSIHWNPKLYPSEDFLAEVIKLLPQRAPEDFAWTASGDPLMDALAQVDPGEAEAMLSIPGVLRGIELTFDRAQRILNRYILNYLEGDLYYEDGINLSDILGSPSFPQELIWQAAEVIAVPEHTNQAYYIKPRRLKAWNSYLSRAEDPEFLAKCANLFFKYLQADPTTRNQDEGIYVELLASTTSHPTFPASWVEEHYLNGNGSWCPIATATDYTSFQAKYPKSGASDHVIHAVRVENRANRAVDLGAFVLWAAPAFYSDEQAFARVHRCLSVEPLRLSSCDLPTFGYYFHAIREMKEELGTPDIPDEWVSVLLS